MAILRDFLGARLDPGAYHLYGKAGTGATECCMALAASVVAGGRKVAWIDAGNGFSAATLARVAAWATGKDASAGVLLCRAPNAMAMETAVNNVAGNLAAWDLGAVVVDRPFASLRLAADDPVIRRVLGAQARELVHRLGLACRMGGLILAIANTVGFDPAAGTERPTGEALLRDLGAEPVALLPLVAHDVVMAGARIRWASIDDEAIFAIEGGGFTFHPLPVPVLKGLDDGAEA